MNITRTLIVVPFVLSAVPLCLAGDTSSCQAMGEPVKTGLATYVHTKYKLPSFATVRISEEGTLPDCYRKLKFAAETGFSVSLFLSPDQRYLSPDLFDSHSDPIIEERKVNLALQATLLKGSSVSKGPKEASVTIVEFTDFQCPYCRRAAQLLNDLMASPDGRNVRLVIRQFPLAMHNWARVAAEGSACTAFQSEEAFWRVHDSLFENQTTVTVDNVENRLLEFATKAPGIDVKAYQNCMERALAAGTVAKDINVGTANKVQGTPSFFINGKLTPGVSSLTELQRIVRQALADNRTLEVPGSTTEAHRE